MTTITYAINAVNDWLHRKGTGFIDDDEYYEAVEHVSEKALDLANSKKFWQYLDEVALRGPYFDEEQTRED